MPLALTVISSAFRTATSKVTGWWTALPKKVKVAVVAVLALLLAGGTGYYYGKHTLPAKTITQVDTTTKTKLEEVTAQYEALKTSYATLEKAKTKVVTKVKVKHEQTIIQDIDTKCDETFDAKSGILVRRICEKSQYRSDVEKDERYTSVVKDRDTLKAQVSTLETEKSDLKKKLAEAEAHQSIKEVVTNQTHDRFHLEAGAGVRLGGGGGLQYGLGGAVRLFGPLSLGAEVSTPKTFDDFDILGKLILAF